MGLILRLVVGLGMAGVGTYFVLRTRAFLEFFGPVAWAEAKLGGGGSYLFYKLLGIVFILIGFIVATNMWNAFLQATLGSLFPQSTP